MRKPMQGNASNPEKMNKNGKIASLPKDLRQHVEQLLDDGKGEQEVADLLNQRLADRRAAGETGLPEDINRQNVANWRKTGYREKKAEDRAEEIARKIVKLQNPNDVAENLATWLTAKLAAEVAELEASDCPGEEYRQKLFQIIEALGTIRKGNADTLWIKAEDQRTFLAKQKLLHQVEVHRDNLRYKYERGQFDVEKETAKLQGENLESR